MPIPHPETLEPGVMYSVDFTRGWDGQEQSESIRGVFIKTSVEYNGLVLHFRVRGSIENRLIDFKLVTNIRRGVA